MWKGSWKTWWTFPIGLGLTSANLVIWLMLGKLPLGNEALLSIGILCLVASLLERSLRKL